MSGKTSKSKWAAVIVGAFVVLTAVGCGGGSSPAGSGGSAGKSGQTITGTATIFAPDISTNARPCHGTGGREDFKEGLGIVVKDDSDKVIATSALGPGTSAPDPDATDLFDCVFPFTIANVPEVPFYSVEVGKRGALTYSLAEMKSANWTLAFTLD